MTEGQYPGGGYQPPYGHGYSAFGQQPPYYSQPPKKRPVWPWIVGGILLVLLLSIGGCIAVVATIANDATEEVTVTYEVSGDGEEVSISYSGADLNSGQVNDAVLPWRMEVTVEGLFKSVYVTATNGAEDTGEVSCKITANGKVVAEQTSSGAFASASCIGFAS